ncbi:tungstate ABC transporter substrate-binding protein WtpA [Halanaerobaculum tunisiense]
MRKRKVIITLVIVLALAFVVQPQVGNAWWIFGDDEETGKASEVSGEVVIFHAGSLSIPFKQAEKAFEKEYPAVDVKREAAGSRDTVRKVTDLGRRADIVASADYTVIEELMVPEFTKWRANFVTNEMAIMYTKHSKYGDKINEDNWYKILLKDDVEYGHSNPDVDPCGYRSQLVWKLAEKHYDEANLYERLDSGCPQENVRAKETDLISLLEAGELDYLFIYRSVAEQHGLPFTTLPEKINLKTNQYADFYKTVSYEVSGKKPGETITKVGLPMVYGVTIPNNAPNREAANAFMEFLLGEKGQKIMKENGQPSIAPAKVNDIDKVPEQLKDLTVEK